MNSGPFFHNHDRPEQEPGGADHGFAAALKRIVLLPFHAVGVRYRASELDKLSEHDLQDIGLTSEDVGGTHGAAHDVELGDAIFDERHDQIPRRRDTGRLH